MLLNKLKSGLFVFSLPPVVLGEWWAVIRGRYRGES